MSHEITIQQAAERADQANITLMMLCKAIDGMDVCDIKTAVLMVCRLVNSASAWLIEEQAQWEKAHG